MADEIMEWVGRLPYIIGVEKDGMEWFPWRAPWDEGDEPDSDEEFDCAPYLHRDAARAWQAFRDWCGPSRVCVWTQSEYDLWETDCDGAFQLNDGGPHDNDMTFCCYCGGELVEQAYEDAEVDDDD